MPRPGIDVALLDTPSTLSTPTDTGTAFVTGTSDMGSATVPTLIRSLNEFAQVYGTRQSYSVLYDWIEHFFREGGNRVYVARVVGPSATSGTKTLNDAGASSSLIATAIGPGAWSANYKVAVVAGTVSGFRIQVTDASNNVLEDSGDLADQNSAIIWSGRSKYIRLTLGVSTNNPAVAAASALSAGNDDRSNITDAQWLAAQNLFTADLGPGQVCQPGRTSSTAYSQLLTHAQNNSRVAILDLADTATTSTLLTAVSTLKSRYGAGFAPWIRIPGTTAASTRLVPPSALVCGLIARNDRPLGANRASAGIAGISMYGIDVSQPSLATSLATLNAAGVNVIRTMNGGVRVYGWRSLADPINDPNWVNFGNSRLNMDLEAELASVGENYVFDEIDGQNGITINSFHDALAGVMMAHFTNGELFGETPDQAFNVDTSPAVNTLATIANLELHAVVNYRAASMAEWVQIQVVKRQITDTL